ncbi:DUF6000 family protein [Streptomyces sp. NPDC094049]|uniref:DUF6000 family protein n=1 Tax=Streptomyces sp. NPDC094049 TaxID=3154987 RepID=UPI00332837F2
MRDVCDDPELRDLIRRFVNPGRRYLRLTGSLLRLSGTEREQFGRELARAAGEITPAELGVLLEGGWRERRTACWLIAVAGRTEFRGRLGERLLADANPYGGAYCVALSTFATDADADLVCAYLDRYLPRPDLGYDQTFALSTLLHLDTVLGTERASRYLAVDGLWQRWSDATPGTPGDPWEYQRIVAQLCSFAHECAGLLAGGEKDCSPPRLRVSGQGRRDATRLGRAGTG